MLSIKVPAEYIPVISLYGFGGYETWDIIITL